jgi:hypothetical protein
LNSANLLKTINQLQEMLIITNIYPDES